MLQINFAGRRLTVATSGGSGSWDWDWQWDGEFWTSLHQVGHHHRHPSKAFGAPSVIY